MTRKSIAKTRANEAKRNAALVERVVKRYGAVIDLNKNPGMVIDIIRRFRNDVLFNDNPCGGTPQGPAPSPGPTKAGSIVSNDDLMKAILRIARDLGALKGAVSKIK